MEGTIDIGKVADAAYQGAKRVFPDATLSQRDGRYVIRLRPDDRDEITVLHPSYTPNGHVDVNGLHELRTPVEARIWIIARIMNSGHSVKYDRVIGKLTVQGKKF